jgi:signal transduction histidine kinase
LLYDERNPRLYFAAATGISPAQLAETPVPIDGSLAGTIFRTNQHLILNDAEHDPRHYSLVSEHIRFKVKSLLGVPMSIRERTVGVLEAVNKRIGGFDARDAALLSVMTTHAAVAIDNARLLQTTKKALQQVKESDRLKSHFLSLASQELRAPLGIIISYSTYLKVEVEGENSNRASQVLLAAQKMRSLLDEMNNLAMLKSEEMILKPQHVSLQEILTSAVEEIRTFAAAHDQKLTFILPEYPIPVNVDVSKTTLAFTNLLNNAIRYSPPGCEIAIGAIQDGEDVLAWVQDRGRGIPRDQLQKIFEEFYQVDETETHHTGGLGIGLSIAKGIIEAQEGEIWAESEGEGAGATFKVLLPRAPAP